MVRSLLSLVTLAAVLPAFVSAHGQLRGVTVNGQWYDAPNLYYDGDARNQNTPIRKGYKADFPSYLLPTNFADNNKMACQEAGAAPGIAKVSPGQKVTWKWEGATKELSDQGFPDGTWVHAMGFTSTWIADCNGDCKNVDASQVGWSKIDFNGLNPGNIVDNLRNAMANKPEPYRSQGLWAMAQMIENDSQYDSFIPNNLKNGQYLLRSEISAVHNPFNGDPSSGPQNYVGCLQIQVENGGDVTLPGGTKAGSFYDPNGDYAHYSVFNSPASFAEPGPAKWDGASASGNTNNGGNTGGNTGNTGNNNSGNTGGDNSNNNNNNSGNTGGDNNNSGNTGGDSNNNSGGNNNTGSGSPSSGNNGKQCRRRSNSKRSKVARSLHAAHAKRHH